MTLKKLLLFALLIPLCTLLFAQQGSEGFMFEKVLPPTGNTFIHVTGITQDSSGYMWFATKKGLYRYDGYTMTHYKNDPLDGNSLPFDQLEAIATDKAGNIWLGTLGAGLLKFDPVHAKFTQYRHSDTTSSSVNADWISAVMADKNGNIWVGAGNGLDRLDQATGKFTHYTSDKNNPRSLSSNPVFSIYQDRQGTIWVGTGTIYGPDKTDPTIGGLNRMDDISGKFTRFVSDPKNPNTLINNKVRAIYESSDGTFWVGTAGDGLHTMDRKTGKFRRHTYDPAQPGKLSRPALGPDPFTMITFITEDKKGGIWIGTSDAGLTYYDPRSRDIRRMHEEEPGGYGFDQRDAWAAYTSSEGVLWISSFMGSLLKVNTMQLQIPFFPMNGREIAGFHEEDNGTFWIATGESGLFQMDRNKNIVKHFVRDPYDNETLANDSLFSIKADSYGNIWLGTLGSGVDMLAKNRKTFIHYEHDSTNNRSLSNKIVLYCYEDRKQNMWFGTFRGLNLLDRKTNSFRRYIFYPNDYDPHGKNIVSAIVQDRNLQYWVSSFGGGGVHALNAESGQFKTYLQGLSIARLLEDSQGRLWAGGIEGLFLYDVGKDTFIRYSDPLGVRDIIDVKSIAEDNEKNLWISAGDNIVKINKTADLITVYDEHYHLVGKLGYGMAYVDKRDNVYFPAISGYYRISPGDLNSQAVPPKILISNFRLANKEVFPGENSTLKTSIANTASLQLNYDQNVFSFDFAAIDFIDPQANKHLFKLENYDRSWNLAGSERRALYFNVPPGKYVFRVRAVNAYGKWAERTIDIEIVPAWWSQWWFRIAALLVTVVLIYLLIRWRLQEKFRLQMERADREKELSLLQHRTAQLEMHALRAQMNPHFLFNSLNSINRFILQNNSDQASAYLTKFSRLMRLILQNSQNELVPLENELEALKLYLELEAVRFDHQFTYQVKIDENLDTTLLKVPPLIIQPYAENAIWHGLMHKEEKGHLLIELVGEGDFLICRIIDDGVGRQKAADLKSKSASTHKSMGMKITADRINTMKQKRSNQNHIQITDLVHPDGTPAGTSVEIKISLQYD